ncbi:hypothetical protein PHAVU_008G191200 [Phaseolus vulgaris]|uniref:Uncharacterized protein n=2 Tax=Phaseolus vulgaris TaxID=3885 RepID=V7B945_PHAVU|nr:hypothetical protein PHAVU_008G191200g [Phaseolus vulgaris]ESW13383.1 hypothetical protein PHAVU_008G191200g [Phaseolus vulgaris]
MPSVSRRKAKQAKKLKTWSILNHHSSPAHQIQGEAVSANNSKKMEGFLNGTIRDSQKVGTQSLSEDKEVAVEVDDSQDGDIVITHEEEAPQSEEKKVLVESGKLEETEEDVSESVAETFEPDTVKDAQVENTVESDAVMIEFNEDFESDPDGVKGTDLYPSVSGNEGLRETEVVETAIVKDMTVAEEEKNVVPDAVSKTLLGEVEEANDVCGDYSLTLTDAETSVPKPCESDKVAPTIIEKSLDLKLTLDESVQESSGGLEESSYESAKESFQPSLSVVPDAESNENQTTVPVAQREITSWKSCCGLIEIMRGGGR